MNRFQNNFLQQARLGTILKNTRSKISFLQDTVQDLQFDSDDHVSRSYYWNFAVYCQYFQKWNSQIFCYEILISRKSCKFPLSRFSDHI